MRFSTQALEGKDIKELLTNVGSAGPAAAAPAGGAAAEAPAEAKAEEKVEGKFCDAHLVREISVLIPTTEKEESDEDMGFGLFD
ncbi:MAG: hypothetical protein LBE67_06170 [Kocuria palustris]|nr:hypothetical protein [Kocuria palustris]